MTQQDERDREIAALRDRLSRLSEASLRINESLHLDEQRARADVETLIDTSPTPLPQGSGDSLQQVRTFQPLPIPAYESPQS